MCFPEVGAFVAHVPVISDDADAGYSIDIYDVPACPCPCHWPDLADARYCYQQRHDRQAVGCVRLVSSTRP